jgi:hypothetical protein
MSPALAAFALVFSSSFAQAAAKFDGCYQLYLPNIMYPAFCLDGTTEEGIGSAGARLVFFGTNTDRIIACGSSSALVIRGDSLEFVQIGQSELILKNVTMNRGFLQGDAVLGSTELKFLKLDDANSSRLLKKFYQDERCEGLAPGELRNLK